MKEKKIIALIGMIILIPFFIYIFFYEKQANEYYACKDLKTFKESTINCNVEDKYIDKTNHSFRTINFTNCDKMIIISDTSGFYEFVSKGDYIVKPSKTDTVRVYRKGQIYSFKYTYFGCNE